MASRCGVFAKTDVQNLLSRKVAHEDIAASILNAAVIQTLGTLARGHQPLPLFLFSGGPLTFIPALKTAFIELLGVDESDVLEVEHSELLPALGAALAEHPDQRLIPLSTLIDSLNKKQESNGAREHRLLPLFKDENELESWQETGAQYRVKRFPIDQMDGSLSFLGVDSGSTTSKIVLIDEQGRVLFDYYCNNKGDAISAVREGLEALGRSFSEHGLDPEIARSVVTGYGEDLIKAAYAFDEGMVETLAHYRAAREFDRNVSFVLDIGGQDMKAIFVKDGHIQNIEINEACSSGCGTFIESFAHSMGDTVSDFADKACYSKAPCDLGSRCTVFMNSSVKQALREAASVSDISAGLAYSVIKNAIHKVLKITDVSVLGEHIVVQGGTFRNPAVRKAMETLLERPVICPDIAELMGAYGAALSARDIYRSNGSGPSSFVGLKNLDLAVNFEKRLIRCKGCENRCAVTKLIFNNENLFYTGNRCERIFTNSGKRVRRGVSLHDAKYKLIFDRETVPASSSAMTIGIPRVLNIYENYPFWNTLLRESGFKVQLSDPSDTDLLQKGNDSVMSENICFPAKLAHGHVIDLIEKGVDRIFYPMVFWAEREFSDAVNCFNCPIVSGYPDVIRSAIDPEGKHGVPFDQPSFVFHDRKLLERACRQYLAELGVGRTTSKRAFKRALAAQAEFKDAVRAAGAEIVDRARDSGRTVILLMGRPYHLDKMINHGVSDILVDFGIDVITEDSVPLDRRQTLDNKHILTQWEYLNRCYHAADWVGQQENVEVVQLNSFACGPDAFSMDEVKMILNSYGKGHTVIRIDEIESIGSTKLRLRSLIERLNQAKAFRPARTPRKTVRPFDEADRQKTILVPHFSHFCAPPAVRPLIDLGYDIQALPPPDRESVEIGLKYVQNEVCYPAIIVVGDLIKGLQSGKYDPADVAVGYFQTGGQCRASCYLSLIKRALIAAGFEDVPAVAVSTTKAVQEQSSFEIDFKKYIYKGVMAAVYSDAISNMYHATAVREVNKGSALALADQLLVPLWDGTLSLDRNSILQGLEKAVSSFNRVATKNQVYPRVGIVGEIYVKFNAFSNKRVVQWLMDQEIEVFTPSLLEFFAAWLLVPTVQIKANMRRHDILWLLIKLLEGTVQNFLDETEDVLSKHHYYRPRHSIHQAAEKAAEILALTHQYGESWLIAGEISELVDSGTENVLCLQPFGCIANQVVARGVSNRLKEKYPQLNLLFLDVDQGTSEVNFFNRMHFFIDHARKVL
jgi:predicted CoA-substrate-specific enzyme activase